MKINAEIVIERMETIIDLTKEVVESRGEAHPALFMFMENTGRDQAEHELAARLEQEPWLAGTLNPSSASELENMSEDEQNGYKVIPRGCTPIQAQEDLDAMDAAAREMAKDPKCLAVGCVLNVLVGDSPEELDEAVATDGGQMAIYVGFYIRGEEGVSHKLIPYRVIGDLTNEEKLARGPSRVGSHLPPNMKVMFIDHLWDSGDEGTEEMLTNPFGSKED